MGIQIGFGKRGGVYAPGLYIVRLEQDGMRAKINWWVWFCREEMHAKCVTSALTNNGRDIHPLIPMQVWQMPALTPPPGADEHDVSRRSRNRWRSVFFDIFFKWCWWWCQWSSVRKYSAKKCRWPRKMRWWGAPEKDDIGASVDEQSKGHFALRWRVKRLNVKVEGRTKDAITRVVL